MTTRFFIGSIGLGFAGGAGITIIMGQWLTELLLAHFATLKVPDRVAFMVSGIICMLWGFGAFVWGLNENHQTVEMTDYEEINQ